MSNTFLLKSSGKNQSRFGVLDIQTLEMLSFYYYYHIDPFFERKRRHHHMTGTPRNPQIIKISKRKSQERFMFLIAQGIMDKQMKSSSITFRLSRWTIHHLQNPTFFKHTHSGIMKHIRLTDNKTATRAICLISTSVTV
jgi:hypothetical protein